MNYSTGTMRSLALCLLFATALPAAAQNTYTWTNAGSGNWSTGSDWTNGTSTGTAPTSADIANFNNSSTAQTLTLDTSAPSSIYSLNLTQTSANAVETFSLGESATITNSLTQYTSFGSAGANSDALISLNGKNLTIANNAVWTIGNSTASNEVSTTYFTTDSVGNATVQINGTLLFTNADSAQTFYYLGGGTGSPTDTLQVGGTGTINLNENTSGQQLRTYIYNNFNAATGATLKSTGIAAGSAGLYLDGNSNVIATGVNISGLGSLSSGGLVLYGLANQTNSIGTLFGYQIRDGAGTTAITQTYTSTASNNGVDTLYISLQGGGNSNNQTVKLGSNLVLASGQATPFQFLSGSVSNIIATESQTIDLAGFNYDASSAGVAFAPAYVSGGASNVLNDRLFINNSSSVTSTFKATSFNLSNVDMGVSTSGGTVIFQATNAGTTNDLGQLTGGSTSISSGSVFYYTGSGSANLQSTGGRSVGAIISGTTAGGSTLVLTSAITAAGNVTSNTGDSIDLNNKALTLSGAAMLMGGGSVANSGGTAASNITFGSGGFAVGGGVGGTTATLTLASNVGATLNSTSNSIFNITSGVNDVVSGGVLTLNGKLTINFLSGFTPYAGETFTLFTGFSSLGGSFTSIVFENAGVSNGSDLGTFSNGVLTMNTVPEPATVAPLGLGLVLLVFVGWRTRRVVG